MNEVRRVDQLSRRTAESQERIAEEVFDPDKVFQRMSDLAEKGLRSLQLEPPEPTELGHTRAARRLVEVLESEGLRPCWMSCRCLPHDRRNPTGTPLDYQVLEVTW